MQSKPIALPVSTPNPAGPANAINLTANTVSATMTNPLANKDSGAGGQTAQQAASVAASAAITSSLTTVPPSSPSASTQQQQQQQASAQQPTAIKQWKQQIEKETEMVQILEGQSNGYSQLVDLYQSPDLFTGPALGEVIPHDFKGVGADVPDWAYAFTTASKSQARIGRLRLKLHNVENLVLNNINLSQQTDPNAGTPFKVEHASISAYIALGNTFHQTSPVDIGVTSSHDDQPQSQPIRSAKGNAKVDQGCVFDLASVTQSLRVQIVINRLQPSRTLDGYTLPEQTLAIPIGFLNIPISSLKPNQVQSLDLALTPTTPQQIAALTQTPSYLRKSSTVSSSQALSSKQPQRASIKVDIELTCSQVGLIWSNFSTTQLYNEASTPPFSLYNVIQYSLLVLNAFRPLLTAFLAVMQLFTWRSPLFTSLFLFIFMFEVFYPIPMTLIIFHLFVLRLLLSPLLNKDKSASSSSSSSATTPPTDTSTKHLFTSSELTASSLHQLAQLTPDSELNNVTLARPTESDNLFVDLFTEFLDQLLPLLYPPSQHQQQHQQHQQSVTPQQGLTNPFSFISLTNFYHSIHSFYAICVTPFTNLVSWQVSPVLALSLTIISLIMLFVVPSHYIYIGIGLLPFLYHSAPVRLLRAVANQ